MAGKGGSIAEYTIGINGDAKSVVGAAAQANLALDSISKNLEEIQKRSTIVFNFDISNLNKAVAGGLKQVITPVMKSLIQETAKGLDKELGEVLKNGSALGNQAYRDPFRKTVGLMNKADRAYVKQQQEAMERAQAYNDAIARMALGNNYGWMSGAEFMSAKKGGKSGKHKTVPPLPMAMASDPYSANLIAQEMQGFKPRSAGGAGRPRGPDGKFLKSERLAPIYTPARGDKGGYESKQFSEAFRYLLSPGIAGHPIASSAFRKYKYDKARGEKGGYTNTKFAEAFRNVLLPGIAGKPIQTQIKRSYSNIFRKAFHQVEQEIGRSTSLKMGYRIRDSFNQARYAGMGATFALSLPIAGGAAAGTLMSAEYEQVRNVLRSIAAGGSEAGWNSSSTKSVVSAADSYALSDNSIFAADDRMKAFTMMYRYGQTTDTGVMTENMRSIEALATFGGTDLYETTQTVMGAQQAYNDEMLTATACTYKMAQATADSAMSMEALQHNLGMAASTAAMAGWNLDQTLASMEALSNAGVPDERIGFYVRGLADTMQNIYSDKAMWATSRSVGLQLLDENNRIQSMPEVVRQYQSLYSNLGAGDKDNPYGYAMWQKVLDQVGSRGDKQALIALMNSKGLTKQDFTTGAGVQYKSGSEIAGGDYLEYLTARNAEANQQVLEFYSGKKLLGFKSSLIDLQKALTSLAVTIADTGLLDNLTKMVDSFSAGAKAIKLMIQNNPSLAYFGIAIAGIAATIPLLVWGFGLLGGAIVNIAMGGKMLLSFSKAFTKLIGADKIVSSTASSVLKLGTSLTAVVAVGAFVIAFVAGVAVAMYKLYQTNERVRSQIDGVVQSIGKDWPEAFIVASWAIKNISFGLMGLGNILGGIGDFASAMFSGTAKLIVDVGSSIYWLVTALKYWSQNKPDKMFEAFTKMAENMGFAVGDTLDNLVAAVKAVGRILFGAVQLIIAPFAFAYDILVGHSIVPDMVNGIVGWLNYLVKAIPSPVKKFMGLLGTILTAKIGGAWAHPTMMAKTFTKTFTAIYDAVKDNPLVKFFNNFFGETIGDISGNWLKVDVLSDGKLGFTIVDQLKTVFSSIWSTLGDNPFVAFITNLFNPPGLDWNTLATGIGDGITTVKDTIVNTIVGVFDAIRDGLAGNSMVEFLGNLFGINNKDIIDATQRLNTFFQNIQSGITTYLSGNAMNAITQLTSFFNTITGNNGSNSNTATGGGGGTSSSSASMILQKRMEAMNIYPMALANMPGMLSLYRALRSAFISIGGVSSELPSLARGGIATSPLTALVGDSPKGPEAIMPISQMPAMIAPELIRLLRNDSSTSGTTTVDLTIELDGDVLVRKTLPLTAEFIRLHGV